ncbi:ScbR family autoregulator-binding transcription factor [Streptomyces sp. NPDC006368]|uniref:ScbR family autoregulator-binding transcription factor n=1 Tax=Streptomyces sp. NPDC006368 TaxID=3156760 RepID=UPI0033A51778
MDHSNTATEAKRPSISVPVDKEPKQERSRRTKQLILDVAAAVFAEEGYPAVSLQAVAERASLTKGAVYFHFGNKEALATAVVQEHYNRWQPIVERVRTQRVSPLERLLAVMDGTAEAFASDRMVQAGARLQIERSLIAANLPRPFVGWEATLAELIEDAREAGQLRADTDPAALARVIVSAFFGMQHISDVLSGRADLMQRYAEMRDVLFKGFITTP